MKIKKPAPVAEPEVYEVEAETPVVEVAEEAAPRPRFARLSLDEIKDDQVYGLRSQARQDFHPTDYPAMGWEIKANHPHHNDHGVLRFFTSGVLPKGAYKFLTVGRSPEGAIPWELVVAVRPWLNSEPPYVVKRAPAAAYVRIKRPVGVFVRVRK